MDHRTQIEFTDAELMILAALMALFIAVIDDDPVGQLAPLLLLQRKSDSLPDFSNKVIAANDALVTRNSSELV